MPRLFAQVTATFASLHYLNYRLWFVGALISNLGAWVQRIGQDWLVLRVLTHGNGIAPAVVTALQFIPVIVLTPWAGLLADRLPRRRLLIATQAGQGFLAFVLGTLTLTGAVRLWHVFVLAFLLGCVTAMDGPVRQTFVTEMVPPDMLPNAVGLNSASFNGSRLVGPAVAGLLIAAVGTGWTFVLNGCTFVATIAGLALMRPALLYQVPKAPVAKGQIRDAIAYVRGRRDLLMIFGIMATISCLGFNTQLTISLMATKVFDRPAGQFGLASSIFAIGALAGALLAARRRHPRLRLVLTAAFCFGIASAISAAMPTYWTYGAAGALVGLCTLTLMTAANSVVQMSTEPALRGRVVALYLLVFQGVTPLGSVIVGVIAEHVSTRWSIGMGAVASLAVSLGALLWARRNWHVVVHLESVFPPRVSVLDAHDTGPLR
ncbi:MAG: MFS transporter [Actinomycetia bacterium]|nr:MFS transporter [Actinomycetes bacterium]